MVVYRVFWLFSIIFLVFGKTIEIFVKWPLEAEAILNLLRIKMLDKTFAPIFLPFWVVLKEKQINFISNSQ